MSCKKENSCTQNPHLCYPFQKGICSSPNFQHDNVVHILQSCPQALRTGECSDAHCSRGHDNLELRRGREQQRMGEIETNLANRRVVEDTRTIEQLGVLKLAMKPGATAYEAQKGKEAASKLQRKLHTGMGNGGENIIRGQLRTEVKNALWRYKQQMSGT
jgi:hypothetical protein